MIAVSLDKAFGEQQTTCRPAVRAVLYARDLQEPTGRYNDQVDACEAYAQARGWVVVNRYIDASSPRTGCRPLDTIGFQNMLKFISRHQVTRVVITVPEALADVADDIPIAMQKIVRAGAQLVVVSDGQTAG